jgi:hypothetical protein
VNGGRAGANIPATIRGDEMGFLRSIFGGRSAEPESYSDAGLRVIKHLISSIPLPEWRGGLPSYTEDEQSAIETVSAQFSHMVDSIAREEGGERMLFHPDVAEPLQRALAEVGLKNFADSQWKYFFTEMGEMALPVETQEGPMFEKMEKTISTYLKCFLCNQNPFALLRLAELLIRLSRLTEALDVLNVIEKFPTFARANQPKKTDFVAAKSVDYLFFDKGCRDLYGTDGTYSHQAIALLAKSARELGYSMRGQRGMS